MSDPLKLICLIGAFILLAAVLVLLSRKRGLPAGTVVYEDLVREGIPAKPLRSKRYGLSGQPDMLIRNGGQLIPVEIKSAPAGSRPYPSHVLQLAAYCLLVEESYGSRPSYGIIRYRDGQFEVPFTKDLQDELLRMMDKLRAADPDGELPPQCGNPRKCRHCGYTRLCHSGSDEHA